MDTIRRNAQLSSCNRQQLPPPVHQFGAHLSQLREGSPGIARLQGQLRMLKRFRAGATLATSCDPNCANSDLFQDTEGFAFKLVSWRLSVMIRT
jgi:hypothetical protein